MSRRDDKDREAILARRRFFVASALAGVVASGCEKPPHPCLDVAPRTPDGEAPANTSTAETPSAEPGPTPEPSAAPMPCLEIAPVPSTSGSSAATEPDASPAPCLRVSTAQPPPTAPPMPCLKIAQPKTK